jgi:hypothetical protein
MAEIDDYLKVKEAFENLEQRRNLEKHMLINELQRLEMKQCLTNTTMHVKQMNLDFKLNNQVEKRKQTLDFQSDMN